MKRKWSKLAICLVAALVCGMSAAFAGCGGRGAPSRDERTINVRVALTGYGADYVRVLKEKFEKTYAAVGYKVNILTPSTDIVGDTVMQEMYSKDDWADVYFTSHMVISRYVNGDYGQLVADLTDSVWNQKPIGFDGREENQTVEQKLNLELSDDIAKVNGRRYSFYSANSIGGMIVNLAKLRKYGCEVPKTTNQLFDAFDKIYNGTTVSGTRVGPSSETGIYPMTYLSGQNGYPLHMAHMLFAQYVGVDKYKEFWGFTDDQGNFLTENGYELYNPTSETGKGLEEMLKVLYKTYDQKYSAPGSAQATISLAHSKIMSATNGGVFMCDGEWAYNECLADYRNTIGDLGFMNVPVISALGVKLFGSGTAYNKSDAECEEMLSWIIDRTDEGKTVAEIKTLASSEKGWNLQDTDVESVCEARGAYYGRSLGGGNVLVCEKSQNKDIAALFLRMFASDDFAKEFTRTTNSYTVFDSEYDPGGRAYAQSFNNILSNRYATALSDRGTALRRQMNLDALLPKSTAFVVTNIINERVTGNDTDYAAAATARLKADYQFCQQTWDEWLRNAGLSA